MVPYRPARHGFLLFLPSSISERTDPISSPSLPPAPPCLLIQSLAVFCLACGTFLCPILLPHMSSSGFLPETVNACSLAVLTLEQFSPHVHGSVLGRPLSTPAWRDFCNLQVRLLTVQTSPQALKEDTSCSPSSKCSSVCLTVRGSTISPSGPYPGPSGPLFISTLTPPSSCQGPTLPLKVSFITN